MEKFVKRNNRVKPGFSVGITLGRKPVKGDVGLEIEVEGKNLPHEEDTPPPWQYHIDGSLRGQDNGEYVLASPVAFGEVGKALETLWSAFAKKKTELDESNRTSVHVHINVQNFHLNRLTSFMALYITFEEILTQWCGEHRVGNLFCLSTKDATAIIHKIKAFIKGDCDVNCFSDGLHYSGMNASALQKFGSLEFRTLRGVKDPSIMLDWVEILERLYNLSAEFEDPRALCHLFSASGPLPFFESVLGNKADVVKQGSGYTLDRLCESMYEGIRLAQDICYCRDWSDYKAMLLKPDPFKRDMKKIAKKVMAAGGSEAAEFFPDSPPTATALGLNLGSHTPSTTYFSSNEQWSSPFHIEVNNE